MELDLNPNVLKQLFTTDSSRSFKSIHFVLHVIERFFNGDQSLQGAHKDITNLEQATFEFNDNHFILDAMVNKY